VTGDTDETVVQDLEMAALEETSASRYVKLGKEQDAPVEDIRPGELNQPVHVPQVVEQFSSVRSGFLWILFFPPRSLLRF
jgi:hypothetical protein